MTKQDVIGCLRGMGYTKEKATRAVDDVLNIIMGAVSTGDDVVLHGFGTFTSVDVAARKITNIATGRVDIAGAYRRPKFIPSMTFRNAVNQDDEGGDGGAGY